MASIFTKIINGEIPSHKVAENDKFYAFLDISPLQKGHTLVVPKIEVDEFFNVDDETMAEMIVFAKSVAAKIKKSFPCNRVGMTVIGLEVPHAHIHLIPINQEKDMNFHSPKLKLEAEEFEQIAVTLRNA
jgi:histidine triad (HIT) family protein